MYFIPSTSNSLINGILNFPYMLVSFVLAIISRCTHKDKLSKNLLIIELVIMVIEIVVIMFFVIVSIVFFGVALGTFSGIAAKFMSGCTEIG